MDANAIVYTCRGLIVILVCISLRAFRIKVNPDKEAQREYSAPMMEVHNEEKNKKEIFLYYPGNKNDHLGSYGHGL